MLTLRSLSEGSFGEKRVLVRVDHNIETDENGVLKNDEKIQMTLHTLRTLLEQGARLILMTHVGRPKGKRDPKHSTEPLAAHLRTLLPDVAITHCRETTGPDVERAADQLKSGSILYLENVRYSPDEEGSPERQKAYGKQLAALADCYVNEAFASCHSYEEASTCAVARLLPSYAGIQLQKEVEHLSRLTEDPRRPLTLIISGAKITTKLPVIEHFLGKGDDILLGGAIANTFLGARGFNVARSKVEEQFYEKARELMLASERTETANIHVPRDGVVASELSDKAEVLGLPLEDIEGDMAIFDIGRVTRERYCDCIRSSGSIVWNGPVGCYEYPSFSHGTRAIAEAVREATAKGALSVIGGGDTIDAHARYGLPLGGYTFVSTGGGAMLEFISGEKMPAIEALRR